MSKLLNFLKDLPEGDLYEIECADDEEITVYVHVDHFGKIRSFPNNCKKVSVSELIKRETNFIEEDLCLMKADLYDIKAEIKILENIISSPDNDLLKDFFEVKDFSDNAFRQLRNKLTNTYLEVNILSEKVVVKEYQVSKNYIHVPGAHTVYETYYDIHDDIEHKRESEIKITAKIEELEKSIM